jgi:hypothetical protein
MGGKKYWRRKKRSTKAHVVVKGFDHNKLANRNHDYLPQ